MKIWLLRITFMIFLLLLALFGFTIGIIASASQNLPSVDKLNIWKPPEATKIYSAEGLLIGSLYDENRTWVSWKEIPKEMIHAIIAVEDSRFYEHHGIDFRGVTRALLANLNHEQVMQGGSTITQQLARNLFLTQKVTIERKVKEALLAMQIERRFSKDEILEFYLNQIYFGSGAYGIESAAHTYFGKGAKDLTLSESALLAGLPQAPSVYSPFNDLQKAKARQTMVLKRMAELGFISRQEAEQGGQAALNLIKQSEGFQGFLYPYFTTFVVAELVKRYSVDVLYKGGLEVYTTLNVKLQEMAEEALRKGIERGLKEGLRSHEGALVAVDPATGFIRAMVGGYQFSKESQFNRAWQARRQPGSAFKIFVYTAALENGFTPASVVSDSPVTYPTGAGPWRPRNDDGRFWGPMKLKEALTWSRNVVAVKLADKIGIEKVVEYGHKLGIKEPLEKNLSLALGSGVVTPLEMVTAAATLANEGVRVEPTPVKMVRDGNGNIIEDHRYPIREAVIQVNTARMMTEMMTSVIERGTGRRAKIDRPAAGKTGTTSDFRDAWFVGFTPDLACAVWIGNDNYAPMVIAYGGYIPAMIWGDFMKKALKDVPKKGFTKAEKVKEKLHEKSSPMKTHPPSRELMSPDEKSPEPSPGEPPLEVIPDETLPSPDAPGATEESPPQGEEEEVQPAPAPSPIPDTPSTPPTQKPNPDDV